MTRDTWLVGGALIAALLIGSGLYFIQAKHIQLPFISSEGTGVKVIAQGMHSTVSERKNYKVVSADQFSEMWGMAYGDAAPTIPQIDFSKKQVLALFAGEKPTAGYGISVESVSDTSDARIVTIVLSEPSKECSTAQSITNPFVLVEINASSLPITKVEKTEITPCSAQ